MSRIETTVTVVGQGEVRIVGLPFAPGTEVDVAITPKPSPATGLRWEGNVLVYQGAGPMPSVADIRDERLNRLADGLSG
jgi:hypothetical protein